MSGSIELAIYKALRNFSTNTSANGVSPSSVTEVGIGLVNQDTGLIDRLRSIQSISPDGATFGALLNGNLVWGGSASGWVAPRAPTVFKEIKNVSVTSGTPISIWTPAAGKKFHILGYTLSNSVAGEILLEDTTGGANEFWRTPALLAGAPFSFGPLNRGYISLAVNNQLFLDVTSSGSVNGIVFGVEE